MTIEEFKNGLVEELPHVPVYHVTVAPEEECPILCWQELGNDYRFGDDEPIATITKVRIDLLVDQEYSTIPDQVSMALRNIGVSFIFDGIGYNVDREEWQAIWEISFLGG